MSDTEVHNNFLLKRNNILIDIKNYNNLLIKCSQAHISTKIVKCNKCKHMSCNDYFIIGVNSNNKM